MADVRIFVLAFLAFLIGLQTLKSNPNCTFRALDTTATTTAMSKTVHQHQEENPAAFAPYIPAILEQKIVDQSRTTLHYDQIDVDECNIYLNETLREQYAESLDDYTQRLDQYNAILNAFHSNITDIRDVNWNKSICDSLDLLRDVFPEGYLSRTHHGFVEPLLPPMRHPKFCKDKRTYLMDLSFLVHDFATICRQIKKHSRTVFFDLGASLEFAGGSPFVLNLIKLYGKFGIKFDHIYAYEYTPIDAGTVYEAIPDDLLPGYHWINVGVEADETSKRNPWYSILQQFRPDDFVVIKMDIDSPLPLEVPLTKQLLDPSKNYSKLVDQFYFEHHVRMKTMLAWWGGSARGTLSESLELFGALRKEGIVAHSWV